MERHLVKRIFLIGCMVASLMISACAQQDFTFGDQIMKNSETAFELGKEWQKGEKMVQKGEKMIKEGKKEINKGETQVKEGEQLVKNGTYLMKNSETRYELLYSDQEQTVPSGK